MAPVVEIFRYAFMGNGTPELGYWALSAFVTLIVLLGSIVLFNRVEKSFMDTV
jgi:lipopolysaccharide transport system permease protein